MRRPLASSPFPPAALKNRQFTRCAKITASNGTEQAISSTVFDSGSAANGNNYYFYVFCDGTETILDLGTQKGGSRGIFDIYLNGALDTAGFDDYNSSADDVTRNVTLARKPAPGWNEVKLVINGKNAGSSNYNLVVYGVRLR